MNKEILKNITVILVEPKGAGNIGSSVRAMKTMGISDLRLVNPVEFREVVEQKKMGYRSQDIVANATEFPTLKDALTDVSVVFLATVRKGKWKQDFITPKESARIIAEEIQDQKIALVFGREDKGVTIDEGQMANYCIKIPTALSYPSLNLAQAVMVVVYEIYSSLFALKIKDRDLPKIAHKEAFTRLTDNIMDLMKSLKFIEQEKGLFTRSLKRTMSRTRWTLADIAVIDKICKQTRWYKNTHTREPEEK